MTRPSNRLSGPVGYFWIHEGMRGLTHCNTGARATGGYGTALGVLRFAWETGKRFSVWVDETWAPLQGACFTTWELEKLGIPYTLISYGAVATLIYQGRVDLVILGADRIAGNGDTANKIGTYSLGGPGLPPRRSFLCGRALVHLRFHHCRRQPHPGWNKVLWNRRSPTSEVSRWPRPGP